MAAQTQGHRAVSAGREEVEKVLIPAPSGVPGPMNKQQWQRVLIGAPAFVNHFEHVVKPSIHYGIGRRHPLS